MSFIGRSILGYTPSGAARSTGQTEQQPA